MFPSLGAAATTPDALCDGTLPRREVLPETKASALLLASIGTDGFREFMKQDSLVKTYECAGMLPLDFYCRPSPIDAGRRCQFPEATLVFHSGERDSKSSSFQEALLDASGAEQCDPARPLICCPGSPDGNNLMGCSSTTSPDTSRRSVPDTSAGDGPRPRVSGIGVAALWSVCVRGRPKWHTREGCTTWPN